MSTENPKTPAEILAELEAEIAKRSIEVKGEDPDTAKKIDEARADLEYLALVERFGKIGKQDQKWSIVDVTAHGRGFIVLVLGPRAEVHRKTVQALARDEKLTDAKLLEIVREYVQHPKLEEFDAMTSELPVLVDPCFLAVQDLWGARAKVRREK